MSWTVRVLSQGKDKSDYCVVRVLDKVGCTDGLIHMARGVKVITFQRQHEVFKTRQEARNLKDKLVVGNPIETDGTSRAGITKGRHIKKSNERKTREQNQRTVRNSRYLDG